MEAPILYTWDPKQRIHSIGGARSVAFSPDGKLLAVGGMGQVGNIDHLEAASHISVFDLESKKSLHELSGEGMKGLVEQLIFLPDTPYLLAIGGDSGGWVQCFSLETKKPVKQEKAPQHLHAAVLNESQDMLFAAGHGKVMAWEMKG
jgi:WD40 repeat protein